MKRLNLIEKKQSEEEIICFNWSMNDILDNTELR